MSYVRIVGLQILDDAEYSAYRSAMAPLLDQHRGSFAWDLRVSDVLYSPGDAAITRAFALRFPDQAAHDAFFAHPDYAPVRERHFDASVGAVTSLGRFIEA